MTLHNMTSPNIIEKVVDLDRIYNIYVYTILYNVNVYIYIRIHIIYNISSTHHYVIYMKRAE